MSQQDTTAVGYWWDVCFYFKSLGNNENITRVLGCFPSGFSFRLFSFALKIEHMEATLALQLFLGVFAVLLVVSLGMRCLVTSPTLYSNTHLKVGLWYGLVCCAGYRLFKRFSSSTPRLRIPEKPKDRAAHCERREYYDVILKSCDAYLICRRSMNYLDRVLFDTNHYSVHKTRMPSRVTGTSLSA